MKKLSTFFRLILAAGIVFTGFTERVLASHAQGADLTYVNVAPNIYAITYKLYRDCTGLNLGTSETLTYRAPGCNATARSLTLQKNLVTIGTPYCQSIIPSCSSAPNALPNYEENVYNGILTLPDQCSNWILSSRIGNRNPSRNLANGGGEFLFTDAMINNVATETNNSPTFGSIPVPFVSVNRTVTYSHSVTDTDGDSLVYSLVPALTDLGVPVVYGTYPAGVSPAPASIPYPAGTFSATNPIISQTPLSFDMFTGSLTFTPLDFVGTAAQAVQGKDKYVLSVQVDEYRKINGVPTRIGYVKRDILVTIFDCGTNELPGLDSILVRSMKYSPGATLETGVGSPFEITFASTDPNPVNIVKINSNAGAAIPGSSFTVFNSGARQGGRFSWTPTMADVRPTPYYFTVTVTDNACPIPGFQVFTMAVRVSANGPTGISKTLPLNTFIAYPNPATTAVTFKIKPDYSIKNAEVVIYNLTGSVVDRVKVKAGEEQVQWNKKADLPAGVYFARLISAEGSQTIKLVHLK